MRLICTPFLVLAPLCALAAHETAPPSNTLTKYARYVVRYEVNDDGTHVETHESAMQVLADQGVSHANQASVSYSDSLQDAEILAAYTLKQDGRRIDAPPSNYQVRSDTGDGSAPPMFSDMKTRSVVLPEVAVGDTIVFSYRVTQKEALFPGYFSMAEAFSKFEVYDSAEITLTAPRSLGVRVQARGVEGGELDADGDRRRWAWTFHNTERVLPEAGAVSPLDYGPLIVASNFRDYADLAAAYNSRAASKAAVSKRIRTLADELTKKQKTPKARATALYNWVAKNIKYAGNCVGKGGVVPHEADAVLANRMGDCKDHTVLLQALLTAKGIANSPVLINSGPAYTLPDVPSVAAFNHVINYIPSLDLYADATAEYVAFGALPPVEYDKPVLHTASFDRIRRTPPADFKANRARTKTRIMIREDGSADGETHFELAGTFAGGPRYWMDYIRPDMEDRMMRSVLSQNGYTGTGTLLREDTSDAKDHYAYGGKYHIDDMINVPGPGAINIKPPVTSFVPIEHFLGEANDPPRTVNYTCAGGSAIEEYTIILPHNVDLLGVPRDVRLEGPHVAYSATYRGKGDTVTIVREFDDSTEASVCTPMDQQARKAFAATVLKDLRAQVVYK